MNQIFRQQGGRRKTRKKRRKRKGGYPDLCKLFGEGGDVEKEKADAYCFDYYLENGVPAKPDWDLTIGPHLRPANTCSAEGKCYREETEAERYRSSRAREAHEAAAESGSTGSTGGRRKTRRKKRRKKKRKTKKRRKRKKRKTKKRYRNQRGCKR